MDLVISNVTDQNSPKLECGTTKSYCIRSKFASRIGAHEFFSPEMWRAALTELVATACLIFTLTSTIIACLESQETDPKLLILFAVFIIAFLFLVATVPLSGGHMSPVFTFIALLRGLITTARAFTYLLAQCIGSIIGFLVLKLVMHHDTADKYLLGGCVVTGLSPGTALMLEFSCTFVVLFVGVTVAFDQRRCRELGLAMVCAVVAGAMALAVFVSVTVTGKSGYSGVGLNPARCLGAALLEGGLLWEGHWVFWAGPFVACIVYCGFSMNLPRKSLVLMDRTSDNCMLPDGIV